MPTYEVIAKLRVRASSKAAARKASSLAMGGKYTGQYSVKILGGSTLVVNEAHPRRRWPKDEPCFRRGRWALRWTKDTNEGYSGDYNPDDPDDKHLYRAYLYDGAGRVRLEDNSFCTMMPVDSAREVLEHTSNLLFDALPEHPANYQRSVMERWTWFADPCVDDESHRQMFRDEMATFWSNEHYAGVKECREPVRRR